MPADLQETNEDGKINFDSKEKVTTISSNFIFIYDLKNYMTQTNNQNKFKQIQQN